MADFIEIDLNGTDRALEKAADVLADTAPLMQELSEVLLTGVEGNFAREEGPNGPWAELAESTKEERARKGKWPGKKLQRSGQLVAATQAFHTGRTAGVLNNKVYGPIHHFGGTEAMPPGPADVPARPFMYVSSQTEDELDDTIADHLDDAGL